MSWIKRKLFNWVSKRKPSNKYSYYFYAYIYLKTKPRIWGIIKKFEEIEESLLQEDNEKALLIVQMFLSNSLPLLEKEGG